jgi:cation diffusion facilitator CzcD-associated flavoprotein CzcO
MTFSPVVIIGAGFGGVAMAIRLKQAGIPFTLLERGNRVGGVWSANTYPVAACDIPSHLYSFSFESDPDWSRKYGKQPEIQHYLERCANKYGCMEHIQFGKEVEGAAFDQSTGRWKIKIRGADDLEAQFLITATGQLSQPSHPRVPGLDGFEGKVFHSANWDHTYDLSGKRVAVAGTDSWSWPPTDAPASAPSGVEVSPPRFSAISASPSS